MSYLGTIYISYLFLPIERNPKGFFFLSKKKEGRQKVKNSPLVYTIWA